MKSEPENIISIKEITPTLVSAIFDIFVSTAKSEAEQIEAELYEDFDADKATQKIIDSLTKNDKYNPVSICANESYSEEGVMFFRHPKDSDQIAIEYDPADRYFLNEGDTNTREVSFNTKLREYLAEKRTSRS